MNYVGGGIQEGMRCATLQVSLPYTMVGSSSTTKFVVEKVRPVVQSNLNSNVN